MTKDIDWKVKYYATQDEFNETLPPEQRIPILSPGNAFNMRTGATIIFDDDSHTLQVMGGQSFDRAIWTKWIFSVYCPGFKLNFMSKAQVCAAVEVCSRLADKVYLQQKSGKCHSKSNVVRLR